jgi:hypothetical protein
MTTHPARSRVRAAVVACGIAAIAAAAGAALGPAMAAGRSQDRAGTAAASVPVVVSCTGQTQTRPGRYVLACADGNAYLTGLHWAAWGPASAFAAGTDTFKVCIPSCTAGHLHSFPALAALWRAEPLPGHPGQRYFTRLTIIYTGNRSYRAGGKTYHLHQTVTYPLSAFGGA